MIPRPDVPPAKPWTFPRPQVSILDNGLTLWAYHLPGQYVLACNLVMELPINAEPIGLDGVATVTARCLDEGTLTHPSSEFSIALEGIGAQFDALVGMSTSQCLLDVPADELTQGLALLAEAVLQPAFDADDVARIAANRLAEIEQQESRGSFLASSALRRAMISSDLRLSRPIGGTTDTVKRISATDPSAFHRSHYQPHGATLIVAGDLSGLDPSGAVQAAFGCWDPLPTHTVPQIPTPGKQIRRLIQRPGAVQADIRIGWFGVDRRDSRWADLQVGLAIMGGTFSSRLNTILREERGYTYGVSMGSHPMRQAGTIELATSTNTTWAGALIEETLDVLLAKKPFTDKEVRDAVNYLVLSAPVTFDTAEAVASQASSLAAARLDLDHVSTALDNLTRVTPQSALAAYHDLIRPDQASIVVVADDESNPDLAELFPPADH